MKIITQFEIEAMLQAHKKYIQGNGGKRLVLRGFSLMGLNLSSAFLRFADFEESVIINCSFEGADLVEASFEGALIRNCNFSRADCSYANFTNVKNQNNSFRGTIMYASKGITY